MLDNPYRSPSNVSSDVPPDARSRFSNITLAIAFCFAAIAQLYFTTMLGGWSYGWYTEGTTSTTPSEFGMYVCAIICNAGTMLTLTGLVRNRRRAIVFRSAFVTLVSFSVMVALDLAGR